MATKPPSPHFTEPTTDYWQTLLPPTTTIPPPPYRYSYPAILPNASILPLPIRPLPNNPKQAVASLLINHASFTVSASLCTSLAELIAPFNPEMIIGLPTLGLSPAAAVAEKLGHSRYIPLGYSRKFWYHDTLSTLLSSITSPSTPKRVFLDPNLLPLIKGKRVAVVDDAVSSGTTINAVWDLLEDDEIGCEIVVCGVVMKQGNKWRDVLGERAQKVVGVFESPLLTMGTVDIDGGWMVRE